MDWFLCDNGRRHERVNNIKNNAILFLFYCGTTQNVSEDRHVLIGLAYSESFKRL